MTDTETAEQRLLRAGEALARTLDDVANGYGSAADARRAQEDCDTALRAYERAQAT